MNRRKYRLRPPTNSGYKSGQVLTFAASESTPQPSELVELTPVGPVPLKLALAPEARETKPGVSAAARRAAFLAALDECEILVGYHNPHSKPAFDLYQWHDVIPDPAVWPALTEFLIRINHVYDCSRFLDLGDGSLASYWIKVEHKSVNGWAFKERAIDWLRRDWRRKWDKIPDDAKRELLEHFAERAARWEGVQELVTMLNQFGKR